LREASGDTDAIDKHRRDTRDRLSDNAEKPVLHMTQREGKEPPLARKEQLKNLIRTEHLNEEEKKVLERICEEFCENIFYLENDALTCTMAVSHEIYTHYR